MKSPSVIKNPRAQSKRGDILQSAISNFCYFGYHGATLDKIAAQAGVSKALVVRFFGSKEYLLVACVRQFISQFTKEIYRNAASNDMTFRQHCDFLFGLFKSHRPEFRLLISIMSTPSTSELVNSVVPEHLDMTNALLNTHPDLEKCTRRREVNYLVYSALVAYVLGGNEENFSHALDWILTQATL